MEKGGKKEKLRMLHPETAAALVNPAFTQNKNLIATPEGIHDDGPFLESSYHRRNVAQDGGEGNVESGRGNSSAVIVYNEELWTGSGVCSNRQHQQRALEWLDCITLALSLRNE